MGALGSWRTPDHALGSVVESHGRGTHASDDLLGETRRLPGNGLPKLGARGDVAKRAPGLVAREDSVRELEVRGLASAG